MQNSSESPMDVRTNKGIKSVGGVGEILVGLGQRCGTDHFKQPFMGQYNSVKMSDLQQNSNPFCAQAHVPEMRL